MFSFKSLEVVDLWSTEFVLKFEVPKEFLSASGYLMDITREICKGFILTNHKILLNNEVSVQINIKDIENLERCRGILKAAFTKYSHLREIAEKVYISLKSGNENAWDEINALSSVGVATVLYMRFGTDFQENFLHAAVDGILPNVIEKIIKLDNEFHRTPKFQTPWLTAGHLEPQKYCAEKITKEEKESHKSAGLINCMKILINCPVNQNQDTPLQLEVNAYQQFFIKNVENKKQECLLNIKKMIHEYDADFTLRDSNRKSPLLLVMTSDYDNILSLFLESKNPERFPSSIDYHIGAKCSRLLTDSYCKRMKIYIEKLDSFIKLAFNEEMDVDFVDEVLSTESTYVAKKEKITVSSQYPVSNDNYKIIIEGPYSYRLMNLFQVIHLLQVNERFQCLKIYLGQVSEKYQIIIELYLYPNEKRDFWKLVSDQRRFDKTLSKLLIEYKQQQASSVSYYIDLMGQLNLIFPRVLTHLVLEYCRSYTSKQETDFFQKEVSTAVFFSMWYKKSTLAFQYAPFLQTLLEAVPKDFSMHNASNIVVNHSEISNSSDNRIGFFVKAERGEAKLEDCKTVTMTLLKPSDEQLVDEYTFNGVLNPHYKP